MGIHHFWREHPPNNGTGLFNPGSTLVGSALAQSCNGALSAWHLFPKLNLTCRSWTFFQVLLASEKGMRASPGQGLAMISANHVCQRLGHGGHLDAERLLCVGAQVSGHQWHWGERHPVSCMCFRSLVIFPWFQRNLSAAISTGNIFLFIFFPADLSKWRVSVDLKGPPTKGRRVLHGLLHRLRAELVPFESPPGLSLPSRRVKGRSSGSNPQGSFDWVESHGGDSQGLTSYARTKYSHRGPFRDSQGLTSYAREKNMK